MGSPGSSLRRQMEAAHVILSRKHLRYQPISVPNLHNSGGPIQRFQDAQVHGLALLLQAAGCQRKTPA